MDGTIIFDKLSQLSNLEYEIFGRDTHKYNIIRYFDKIHSEKDKCNLKIEELEYEIEVKNEEIKIIKEKQRECKERIEELKEELKSKSVKKCSICGETGHNKIGCPSKKV